MDPDVIFMMFAASAHHHAPECNDPVTSWFHNFTTQTRRETSAKMRIHPSNFILGMQEVVMYLKIADAI